MPDKKEFKQPIKLLKREEKWLIGEFSYLGKLKSAVDDLIKFKNDSSKNKESESAKKTVRSLIRLIGKYERRLNKYHKRFLTALKKLEDLGVDDSQIADLKQKIRVFDAELVSDLDRNKGKLFQYFDQENWQEIKNLIPFLEKTITAWVSLDKELVHYEKKMYDGPDFKKQAEILIQELERDPLIAFHPSFLQKLVYYASKSPAAAKAIYNFFKSLYRGASLTFKAGSVGVKSVILVFFAWFWIVHVSPLLQPTTYHRTFQQIQVEMGNKHIINDFLNSLPKAKKDIVIKIALDKNKDIVESQLVIALNNFAGKIYFHIIDELFQKQFDMVNHLRQQSLTNPSIITSKLVSRSKAQVESELLSKLGKSRAQIILDLSTILRQYYTVDILYEKLPGFGKLIEDITKRDIRAIWYDLKWGASQITVKIQAEEKIRLFLNTKFEDDFNNIKDEFTNTVLFGRVWKEVKNTLVKTFTDPSQAKQSFDKLYNALKSSGHSYLVIVLLLVLTGLLPTAGFLLKVFVWNYFRDIYILLSVILRRR